MLFWPEVHGGCPHRGPELRERVCRNIFVSLWLQDLLPAPMSFPGTIAETVLAQTIDLNLDEYTSGKRTPSTDVQPLHPRMLLSIVLEAPIPKMSFGDKTSLYVMCVCIYIYIHTYIFRQAATFAQDWVAGDTHAYTQAVTYAFRHASFRAFVDFRVALLSLRLPPTNISHTNISLSLYIYIHIRMYVCVYVYIYIYICIYLYSSFYNIVYVCIYIYICTHVYIDMILYVQLLAAD